MMRRSLSVLLASFLVAAVSAASEDARPASGEAAGAPSSAGADAQGEPEDRAAPVLTAGNLFENESYWPYRVKLTEPFRAPGRERALPPRTPGVLIRLEDPGTALIDFAKLGVHRVPVAGTDLVDEANKIAGGSTHKFGPNLTVALGPRLQVSDPAGMHGVTYHELAEQKAFLCVFADPDSAQFGEIAKALAPLQKTEGFRTVFFPQGDHADAKVHETLVAAGWETPFMLDRLSESYTKGLLVDGSIPSVTLNTPEGRLLFQSEWKADVLAPLTGAIEKFLGNQAGAADVVAAEMPLDG